MSVEEAIGGKGYHSKHLMVDLALAGRRSYISEPTRGPQQWEGEAAEREGRTQTADGRRACAGSA